MIFQLFPIFFTYWNQQQKVIQSKKEIWHHDGKLPLCNEILLTSHSKDSCGKTLDFPIHSKLQFSIVLFPFVKIFICKSKMYNKTCKCNCYPVWFWKVCLCAFKQCRISVWLHCCLPLQSWHCIHHSYFLKERKSIRAKEICEALEDLILCKLLLWFLPGCVQWQVGAGCEENNFQNHIDKVLKP